MLQQHSRRYGAFSDVRLSFSVILFVFLHCLSFPFCGINCVYIIVNLMFVSLRIFHLHCKIQSFFLFSFKSILKAAIHPLLYDVLSRFLVFSNTINYFILSSCIIFLPIPTICFSYRSFFCTFSTVLHSSMKSIFIVSITLPSSQDFF